MMASVTILGLGDLGLRIAERLTAGGQIERLTLVGRNARLGKAYAALLAASDRVRVEFIEADLLEVTACEKALRHQRPDVVVQAASLISPWTIAQLQHEFADDFRAAGFALQLPFQVPCLRSAMLAIREVGFEGPVVNCSYPDATHALLAAEGLCPTVGIGNVAMVQACVEGVLRRQGRNELIRMVGHHAQTVPVLTSAPLGARLRPWIFVGEAGEPEHDLALRVEPIAWSKSSNVLTAAVAVRTIHALLPGGSTLRTSLPGPAGLQGGYPVRVGASSVQFDLPHHLRLETAVEQNARVAELDGLADVTDGVAHWVAGAKSVLRRISASLAEPLDATGSLVRARALAHALNLKT